MKEIDPSELKPHPLTKSIPRRAPDDPRFLALCDDVRDHQIRVPLLVTADLKIVDGIERWQAAKKRQLKTIPCVVIPDDQVATTIIQTLVQRKHYTKSALAYITFPFMDAALKEAQGVKSNVRALSARSLQLTADDTADELAEQIGIGRRMFFFAKELHGIFAEHDDLRQQFEPAILDEGIGLGGAIAGVNSKLKSSKKGGGPKPPTRQLELFVEGFETIRVRFGFWTKFDLEQKEEAVKAIRETVKSMPADLRMEWRRALSSAEREEKLEAAA